MKEIQLDIHDHDLAALAKDAQRERVVLTRNGKPSAVIVGVENKDAEDLALENSPEFWRIIEESRRSPTISLERLKSELDLGNLPLCRYSMVIQWSDEANAFIATLPEFENRHVQGDSYEETAIRGQEMLYSLMEEFEVAGKPLPGSVKWSKSQSQPQERLSAMEHSKAG